MYNNIDREMGIDALLEQIGKIVTSKPNPHGGDVSTPAPTPAPPALDAGVTPEKIGDKINIWPQEVAAMPTELTRASLFGLPPDNRERKMLNNVLIASRSDTEIYYTGEELSAKDETVWLACLRMSKGEPMGKRIYFNKIDLLRELNISNTGQNWRSVESRLHRLSKAHFTISFKRGNKSYKMTTGLMKFGIEDETGNMYIRLDPDGAALFSNLSYQPWSVRLSLSDVAARLLTYISGHEQGKPHAQSLSNLMKWCGYSGRSDKFLKRCQEALLELENMGIISNTKIVRGGNGDIACWVRSKTSPGPDS